MAIEILTYNKKTGLSEVSEAPYLKDLPSDTIIWLDIESASEVALEKIAEKFDLHELAIEDSLTRDHLPKFEDFGRYHFMLFRSLFLAAKESNEEQLELFSSEKEEQSTRSLSLFFGPNFLITHRTEEIAW